MRLALLLALFLVGCSAPVYHQAGVTESQHTRDTYECRRDAEFMAPTQVTAGGMIGSLQMSDTLGRRRDMYDHCMRAKGYRRQ